MLTNTIYFCFLVMQFHQCSLDADSSTLHLCGIMALLTKAHTHTPISATVVSPLSTVIHTACLEIVYGFLHTTFGRESLNCNCIEFKFSSKSTTTYSSQSMAKHMEMHKLDFLFLASFFSSNFFDFFIRMTTTTTMTTVLTMLACNSRYKAVKLK